MKVRKHISRLALITGISLLSSCGPNMQRRSYEAMLGSLLKHSVPECSVTQAAADSGAVFLDARELREFEVSHIRHAVWVGHKSFDLSHLKGIDKTKPLIVYCSIGYRSEKIAEKLASAGYTSVSNLYGGIFEWVNESNPVYNTRGQTSEVHAYNKLWSRWLRKGKKVYN